jgi:hypothetical protein
MKKNYVLILIVFALSSMRLFSVIHHVGISQTYTNLTQATAIAQPGDTIMVHTGTYAGGLNINNLQGTSTAWIRIFTAPNSTVIYNGGNNAWQMTDAAYIHIRGFIFQQQTGNGFNMDDGGTYNTPSHHILFENCTFRNINATGNNDLLKLSGVDDFEIRNCNFINGSFNGSGIDMVGCHNGIIRGCFFDYQGTFNNTNYGNGIQAKGGSANIRMEANFLRNTGPRAFNLGGSTSAAFFRPANAPYEASDLKVYANIIIGTDASVAFVGCINTEVINNTIYLPTRWAIRILQENTDPAMATCGNNKFINNIIFRDNQMVTECNIGPSTAPSTFTISHNLWYHAQNPSWTGPTSLPVTDPNQLVSNPLFVNPSALNFSLQPTSPAIGSGSGVSQPLTDYNGNAFNPTARSRGAIEGNVTTELFDHLRVGKFQLFPNPVKEDVFFLTMDRENHPLSVELFDLNGKRINANVNALSNVKYQIKIEDASNGIYFVKIISDIDGAVTVRLIVE